MDWKWSKEEEDFRQEVRDYLKAELPPGWGKEIFYDQDDDKEQAPSVLRLKGEIAAADGIMFATPEYNSSVPGHLKNALDWVSRPVATNPLRNMPVAVVGASTGMFGAVWAQAELRKVCAAIGARVLEVDTRQVIAGTLDDLQIADRSLPFGQRDSLSQRRQGTRHPRSHGLRCRRVLQVVLHDEADDGGVRRREPRLHRVAGRSNARPRRHLPWPSCAP